MLESFISYTHAHMHVHTYIFTQVKIYVDTYTTFVQCMYVCMRIHTTYTQYICTYTHIHCLRVVQYISTMAYRVYYTLSPVLVQRRYRETQRYVQNTTSVDPR